MCKCFLWLVTSSRACRLRLSIVCNDHPSDRPWPIKNKSCLHQHRCLETSLIIGGAVKHDDSPIVGEGGGSNGGEGVDGVRIYVLSAGLGQSLQPTSDSEGQ